MLDTWKDSRVFLSVILKTRTSKLARTALMGQETLRNITRTAFYEVCTLKWVLMCLFTVLARHIGNREDPGNEVC